MKQLSRRLLGGLATAWLFAAGLQAQSLDQAKKHYNDGEYAEAMPAFERLVKQSPGNASYNLWYGVCCYETGQLEKAERHLVVAVKRRVQEAYRYLGKVYFKTYRFDKASETYADYIELLEKKKQPTEEFEALEEQADNAMRMVDKVEDVELIDSLVVNKPDLLNAYTLSEESGKLMSYEEFFQTGNSATESTVYMNQRGDKIYYAHSTDDHHYCLFSQSRLRDHWGDEKQLPMNVNSGEDDNYPFVLSDGVTLYYASKGNGSLGGYDLFVTRYNMSSDTYLAPEQLGMPFNSPYNDYMMVIDEAKGLGWFASDRFQPEGKVCIYLFIPNEQRPRVENEDEEVKRSRAMIASIKDSWKAGADYSAQIALAHKAIPFGKQKIEKDFDFVINDKRTYYRWEEIQSPEARSYYKKAVDLRRQIQALEKKLEEQRTAYHRAGAAQRKQLSPTILEEEERLNELLGQPAEWEKKARNAEIIYLKKK